MHIKNVNLTSKFQFQNTENLFYEEFYCDAFMKNSTPFVPKTINRTNAKYLINQNFYYGIYQIALEQIEALKKGIRKRIFTSAYKMISRRF